MTHTSSDYFGGPESQAEMQYDDVPQFLSPTQRVGWVSYLGGYAFVARLVALKAGQKKCVGGSLTTLFPDPTGKHVAGSVYISEIQVVARMKAGKDADGRVVRREVKFGKIYEYNSGLEQKKKK